MPGTGFPIQETQVGAVAYLFGITNNGTPISWTGVASFETDSDDLTHTWKEKENTDTTGNVQNIVQSNFKYERTIKFSPSGATRAAAAAVADAVVALANLVVANHAVTTFNGTWRIKPGLKINLKMDDDASIDLPCEKYVNATQNTALTGAPIAG
jgi:hypothetical protein